MDLALSTRANAWFWAWFSGPDSQAWFFGRPSVESSDDHDLKAVRPGYPLSHFALARRLRRNERGA
ncbi:hypothetical protein PSAC2689_90010 [Paraburkholderia sacchari]